CGQHVGVGTHIRGADDRGQPLRQHGDSDRNAPRSTSPSGVDGRYSVNAPERTMTLAYFARLTATLSRFRLSRNAIPRGTSSGDDAVIDTNTTGACRPWNLSTVPTSTSESPAVSSSSRSRTTCALYGATTNKSSGCSRRLPCSSVHLAPNMFWISPTIAAASSGLLVELPLWSTNRFRTPGGYPSRQRAPVSCSSECSRPS